MVVVVRGLLPGRQVSAVVVSRERRLRRLRVSADVGGPVHRALGRACASRYVVYSSKRVETPMSVDDSRWRHRLES